MSKPGYHSGVLPATSAGPPGRAALFTPQISDAAWAAVAPHLPPPKPPHANGRPRRDDRDCLEGILFVLRTGCRWRDLPPHLPSGSTCRRRLAEWHAAGRLAAMWSAFLAALAARGRVKWAELTVDGTFVPAKRGARRSAAGAGGWARG